MTYQYFVKLLHLSKFSYCNRNSTKQIEMASLNLKIYQIRDIYYTWMVKQA